MLPYSNVCLFSVYKLILSQFPDLPPPATFKRGNCSGCSLIDGTWASDNVTILAASWQLVDLSLGNHHAIIINIILVDCIGEPCYTVVCPPGQQLNSALPLMRKKYLKLLDKYMAKHQVLHKLDHLFLLVASPATLKEALLHDLEIFDKVKMEGMKYVEHKCHHLHMGALQFSPELTLWHKCHTLAIGPLLSDGP